MKLNDIEKYFEDNANSYEIGNLIGIKNDLNDLLFEQMIIAKEQIISRNNINFSIHIERTIDLNNAYAKKLSDNIYKINIGEKFTSYFFYFLSKKSEDLLEILVNDKDFENKFKYVPSNDIRDIIYSISVLLFFYHELAHILNNHLEFIKDKNLSKKEFYLEFTDDEKSLDDNIIEIWQALESEADSFAVKQSFLHFMEHKKEKFSIFQKFRKLCDSDFLTLKFYGYAISLTFLFLEIRSNGYHSRNGKHPQPFLRLSRSSTDINQKDILTIITILESCYITSVNKFGFIKDYLSNNAYTEVPKLIHATDKLTKLGLTRFI